MAELADGGHIQGHSTGMDFLKKNLSPPPPPAPWRGAPPVMHGINGEPACQRRSASHAQSPAGPQTSSSPRCEPNADPTDGLGTPLHQPHRSSQPTGVPPASASSPAHRLDGRPETPVVARGTGGAGQRGMWSELASLFRQPAVGTPPTEHTGDPPETPPTASLVSPDSLERMQRQPSVATTACLEVAAAAGGTTSPAHKLSAAGTAPSAAAEAAGAGPSSGCGGYTLMAWLSLALLIIQNSALTLTMRASRVRRVGPQLYLASSAVVVCELVKAGASALLLFREQGGWSGFAATVWKDILRDPVRSNAPLLVPAGLYTLQNNLQYVAASHLDPAVFQVLYQMKLVTTALLSVVALRRSLAALQWAAVLLLTAGVSLVQLANTPAAGRPAAAAAAHPGAAAQSKLVGFVAVFIACITSAGAGVSLEILVKHTRPSVWTRNLQMALFGLVIGLTVCVGKDSAAIRSHGFLAGFDEVVWCVVMLQSIGGLLTAVVVKYADNIIKGFGTGVAIVITCLLSAVFFGFVITAQYCVGAAAVVASVFLFSLHRRCQQQLAAARCTWLRLFCGMLLCAAAGLVYSWGSGWSRAL